MNYEATENEVNPARAAMLGFEPNNLLRQSAITWKTRVSG